MSDLLTSSYHAIGSYGAMYGCISYKYTNYDTYTRIYIYWLGEGLKTTASDAASPYSLATSATITGEILIGSTSKKSWSNTASGTRSGNAVYSSYVWFKAGGSDSNYYDISRTSSNQTVTIKVTYTVSGYSAKTGTTTIIVPKAETSTITYNGNGATSGSMSNTTYTYASSGTTTLRTNTFTKSGYDFLGWNLDGGTTVKYTDGQQWNLSNKGNYTLYAVWKKDITLTYDAKGGSNAPSIQTNTIYNSTTSTNFTVSLTQPTRSNYNFLGWADSGSTTVSYQPGGTISGVSNHKTIDAVWQIAYTPPKITSLVCYRSQSSSTSSSASDTGGCGIIKMSWSLGNDGNDLTTQIKIEYKLSTKTSWTTKLDWTNQDTSITSYSTYIGGTGSNALSEGQYDVRVSVRNSSYSSYATSKIDFISATFYVIDITEDGKGISLLTTAPNKGIALGDYITTDVTLYKSSGDSPSLIFQRGTLTDSYNDWRIYDKGGYLYFGQRGSGSSEWPTSQEWYIDTAGKFTGTIDWSHVNGKADYIVAQGSSASSYSPNGDKWRWREWNSGKVEIWFGGTLTIDGTASSSQGVYRQEKWFNFPNSYSLYNCTVIVSGMSNGGWYGCGGIQNSSSVAEDPRRKFEIMSYRIAAAPSTEANNLSIYICGQKTAV